MHPTNEQVYLMWGSMVICSAGVYQWNTEHTDCAEDNG